MTEVYFTRLPDIANILEALIGYFKTKRNIDLDEALDRIKKTKKQLSSYQKEPHIIEDEDQVIKNLCSLTKS